MRRHRVMLLVLASAAVLCCAALPAATGTAQAGTVAVADGWHAAIEVPGIGALNKGGNAGVNSLACASAGNCLAAGNYRNRYGHSEAFVASERNGTWHSAMEVPGTRALNKGGAAGINSVSCASAGNCLVGGWYTNRSSRHPRPFVASERNGRWHAAIEVPGTGALNKDRDGGVTAVSCASAGNCAAGGYYADGSGNYQAFVASERNGNWHMAIEVPGTRALNTGGAAMVAIDSVSCSSAGNCLAGGDYTSRRSDGQGQVFVASERNGTWRTAIEVPGTRALNKLGDAAINSVSCATAGNCAVGGYYNAGFQAFVASEQNGRWRTAIEVPGTGALNTGRGAGVSSVSCTSPGNCLAGGYYTNRKANQAQQVFVASEQNGTWQTAIEVPGTGALNTGEIADLNEVSCASPGNCVAGGDYLDNFSGQQAFVASEQNGTWQTAIEVPGTAALNAEGIASVSAVWCPSAGNCAVGGSYLDGSDHNQAFVASQT